MNLEVKPSNKKSSSLLSKIMPFVITVILLGVVVIFSFLLQMPQFSQANSLLDGLLAMNSQQLMWYITRSAGFTAYLLLWFSVAWGLAVPSKILDNLLHRTFTYDFHEFISLLAIGFTLIHMVVLMFDRYLPYSAIEIMVPFLSPYRPIWVGIGVIAFYLMVLVTVTFYLRSRIGMKTFRAIHLLSFISYIGVTLHGFLSGTDTPLMSVMAMYVVSFLIIVFLTLYWLFVLIISKQRKNARANASHPVQSAQPQPAPVRPIVRR